MARGEERTGYWFVLALCGVIVLASTGFYWHRFSTCPVGQQVCAVRYRAISARLVTSGLAPLFQPNGAGVYWIIAIPLVFILSWVFFRRAQRRNGLHVRILPAAITTATLLAIVAAMSLGNGPSFLPGDLTVRGLVALLLIGVGIAVLAMTERSVRLGGFAVAYLALALLANLYDIANVIGFGFSPEAEELPNVILPGLLLLLGAISFGLSDLRIRRT